MVITLEIENFAVKNVLIDQGSSVDILYWTTYQKLQLPAKAMIPYDEPIYNYIDLSMQQPIILIPGNAYYT